MDLSGVRELKLSLCDPDNGSYSATWYLSEFCEVTVGGRGQKIMRSGRIMSRTVPEKWIQRRDSASRTSAAYSGCGLFGIQPYMYMINMKNRNCLSV